MVIMYLCTHEGSLIIKDICKIDAVCDNNNYIIA